MLTIHYILIYKNIILKYNVFALDIHYISILENVFVDRCALILYNNTINRVRKAKRS
jgi:hypothetical protein